MPYYFNEVTQEVINISCKGRSSVQKELFRQALTRPVGTKADRYGNSIPVMLRPANDKEIQAYKVQEEERLQRRKTELQAQKTKKSSHILNTVQAFLKATKNETKKK